MSDSTRQTDGRRAPTPAGPDEIDQRLLDLLEQDARIPVAKLVRAVGLARSSVQERLERLERSGRIRQYTIVRGAATRPPTVSAVVTLVIGSRPCEAVISLFRHWPEIRACYSVAGPSDAVLLVDTADPAALGVLRNRLASIPGVVSVSTAPVLAVAVERHGHARATEEA